jgi:hypothetical protein
MERSQLAFSARNRIELAGATAFIPRGARLTLKSRAADMVVVSPVTKFLGPIDVVAPCDDVSMGSVAPEPRTSSENAADEEKTTTYQIASGSLAVAPFPDAEATFTLHDPGGLSVQIEETSKGLHLHLEDGLVIDGWVKREQLRTLMYGRAYPVTCGVGIAHSCGAATASLAIARVPAPIIVGALPTAPRRGTLEAGGNVLVLEVVAGWARVVPRCSELLPRANESFFVPASALEIGPAVPFATFRAGCKT